ncbi:hypothetical protein [Carnobacterium jeotgali]
MFIFKPLYAVILGIVYIGIIYSLVRKEKKYINYSITFVSLVLQLSFLFLWVRKFLILQAVHNEGFQRFEKFATFVNISYFVLFIPLLLIFAWYGIKKISVQDQFLLLKGIFAFFYLGALVGILILGQPIFEILYYGFAP